LVNRIRSSLPSRVVKSQYVPAGSGDVLRKTSPVTGSSPQKKNGATDSFWVRILASDGDVRSTMVTGTVRGRAQGRASRLYGTAKHSEVPLASSVTTRSVAGFQIQYVVLVHGACVGAFDVGRGVGAPVVGAVVVGEDDVGGAVVGAVVVGGGVGGSVVGAIVVGNAVGGSVVGAVEVGKIVGGSVVGASVVGNLVGGSVVGASVVGNLVGGSVVWASVVGNLVGGSVVGPVVMGGVVVGRLVGAAGGGPVDA
jgi:hypothetical protein